MLKLGNYVDRVGDWATIHSVTKKGVDYGWGAGAFTKPYMVRDPDILKWEIRVKDGTLTYLGFSTYLNKLK